LAIGRSVMKRAQVMGSLAHGVSLLRQLANQAKRCTSDLTPTKTQVRGEWHYGENPQKGFGNEQTHAGLHLDELQDQLPELYVSLLRTIDSHFCVWYVVDRCRE
jgi:hypothetical protein